MTANNLNPLDQLQQLAAKQNLTIDQLLAQMEQTSTACTVATFVPRYIEGLTTGTARTYKSPLVLLRDGWSVKPEHVDRVIALATEQGLTLTKSEMTPSPRLPRRLKEPENRPPDNDTHRLVVAGLGGQPIQDVSAAQLKVIRKYVGIRARLTQEMRANARRSEGRTTYNYDGRGAEETFITATRAFFEAAMTEPTVALAVNPALSMKKPPRGERLRRPMTDTQLAQLWTLVQTTGYDPALDTLLVHFHLLSGARRQGALRLTLDDIDVKRCLVHLHEKNRRSRWQPIPPSLIQALLDHARRRGATDPTNPVFHYRDGTPLTDRRYDALSDRVQQRLPWAAECKWDIHTLRVHTSAQIERLYGGAVSDRFLGHAADTTGKLYQRATDEEVATAIQALSGEAHPVAAATARAGDDEQ